MKELFPYLLQSSVALVFLYGIYWLFLRRDTFFSVNRFYLLSIAAISLMIPFLKIDFSQSETFRSAVIYLDPIRITPARVESMKAGYLTLFELARIIYLAGVIFFTSRFILNFVQLFFLIKRNGLTRTSSGVYIIFIDKRLSSFSFFNFVFLSVPYNQGKELTAILDHEDVHVRQHHSIDLIFIEVLKIILWFNPFAWLMGRSMKTIHEFLADEGVLNSGYSRQDYQHVLLHQAAGIQVSALSNNFNFSIIKKRIIMMTKSRSATMAAGKVLFALPALMAVVFFFSSGHFGTLLAQDNTSKEASKSVTKTTAATPAKSTEADQKQQIYYADPIFTVVEKQPSYPGGQDAMIKFLQENIKYPDAAKKKGITGTVFVTFVVKSDGMVSDVKILRGIGSGCDEEAARVVKLMPKWIPGEQKGKTVNVQYNLPIKFALDNHDKKKEEPKK